MFGCVGTIGTGQAEGVIFIREDSTQMRKKQTKAGPVSPLENLFGVAILVLNDQPSHFAN